MIIKNKLSLATRFAIAVLAMGTHFAFAADSANSKSFEDGLQSSYSYSSSKSSESERNSDRRGSWKEIEDGEKSSHYGSWKDADDDMHVTMVPEPATDAMLLAGLAVLMVAARRNQLSKRK